MTAPPNYNLIGIEAGEALKYDTYVNEINRYAAAILQVSFKDFENKSITSTRAQLIYSWILSVSISSLDISEKHSRLVEFLERLTPLEKGDSLRQLLTRNGVATSKNSNSQILEFLTRGFHEEVIAHSKILFLQGNYFHALFEAIKAYHKAVKVKSKSEKDGRALMLEIWGDKGVLKLTTGSSVSENDFQNGIGFLSGGLMSAMRNPIAHEPATHWPIDKTDCLDILGLVSFLFRKLDSSVYYKE